MRVPSLQDCVPERNAAKKQTVTCVNLDTFYLAIFSSSEVVCWSKYSSLAKQCRELFQAASDASQDMAFTIRAYSALMEFKLKLQE